MKKLHFIAVFMMLIASIATYAAEQAAAKNTVQQNPVPTPLSLHQAPDEKSPVVASVGAGQAIIPIFVQGEWIKIGDPSNGNVGWVSVDTLKKQGLPILKTMMQSTDGAGYKTLTEYFSADAQNERMKNWDKQRQTIQTMFNQLIEQNTKTLDLFAKELQNADFSLPVIILQDKKTDASSDNHQNNSDKK